MKSIMNGDKPAKEPKKREMWGDRRSPTAKSFGRASTKGGLSYLKGGDRGGPPVNEGRPDHQPPRSESKYRRTRIRSVNSPPSITSNADRPPNAWLGALIQP